MPSRKQKLVEGGIRAINSLLGFGLLASLLLPGLAIAQSGFDGTWKIDLSSLQKPTKPLVWLVQDGVYQCTSCVPSIKVKADGQDQPVTGQPYDTISVKIVDDNNIEMVERKDGKAVSTEKFTVSRDGNTFTDEFPNGDIVNGKPVMTKIVMTRIAKGPAGSHAASGSWQRSRMEIVPDDSLLFTFKVEGDRLEFSRPTGQSYTAKLDGADAPVRGDPDSNGVSVRETGTNTIEETDKRDGKVISIARMTLAADGKSMSIAWTDVLHGATAQYVAEKQ